MKRILLFLLALALTLGPEFASEANLIQNGDFSNSTDYLAGWSSSGDLEQASIDNATGVRFLTDGSSISRTFDTTANALYKLSFMANLITSDDELPIALLGVSVTPSDLNFGHQLISGLYNYSLNFEASSPSTTLSFERLNWPFSSIVQISDPLITNVSVDPVSSTPIPAALFLFASGLIGLIGVQRKFTRD
jgi:hypothetical protein